MYASAASYVGTSPESGRVQLELLIAEGCLPSSYVLEIGCGCLHAAVALVQYLQPGRYVGVDPNEWLRQSVADEVKELMLRSEARFLSVDDFDASATGIPFDFVLAHSVLSHCAHWQLKQFLFNANKAIGPQGRIVASIRLAEGNYFGSTGYLQGRDSRHERWNYPGVTWFCMETVCRTAQECGLIAIHRPGFTQTMIRKRPEECHDWIVFVKP